MIYTILFTLCMLISNKISFYIYILQYQLIYYKSSSSSISSSSNNNNTIQHSLYSKVMYNEITK